jgi:hypothetical protein
VKTYHFLKLSRWNAEVKNFTRDHCVLIIDHKPFTPSVKDNFVIIFTLHLPVSLHSRSELFKVLFWYFKSSRVIIRVIRPATFAISDILRLSEPWTVLDLVNQLMHVAFSLCHSYGIYLFLNWFFLLICSNMNISLFFFIINNLRSSWSFNCTSLFFLKFLVRNRFFTLVN